ncbi:hypothetical protein QQ045_026563 [Rhodiola kirilowii]
MGEQANYAQPYPAPQGQYINNPQQAAAAPSAQQVPNYSVPETVSRGGGKPPSKGNLGFLEAFLSALFCCCCVEECCSICF